MEGFAVIDFALGKHHAEVCDKCHSICVDMLQALRNECDAMDKVEAAIATGTRMKVDEAKRDDRIAWLNRANGPAIERHRDAFNQLRIALEGTLELRMDSSTFMYAEYVRVIAFPSWLQPCVAGQGCEGLRETSGRSSHETLWAQAHLHLLLERRLGAG